MPAIDLFDGDASAPRDKRLWQHADIFDDLDLPCAVRHSHIHTHCVMHRHSFIELVFVLGGRGEHLHGKRIYPLSVGDCFVIPLDDLHGFRASDDLRLLNVSFDPSRLPLAWEALCAEPALRALFELQPALREGRGMDDCCRLPPERLAELLALAEQLAAELAREGIGRACAVAARLQLLLVAVGREYERHLRPDGTGLLRLAQALRLVDENKLITRPVAELARAAGCSERHLHRLFKTATGMSPLDYQLRQRIVRARELLRTSRDDITGIAFTVGFNDSNYFSRQFRRIVGMSPSAYRRALRAG